MSAEVPLRNCIVIVVRNRGVREPVGNSPGTGIKQATGYPRDLTQMGVDAIAFIRVRGHDAVDLFGFSLGGARLTSSHYYRRVVPKLSSSSPSSESGFVRCAIERIESPTGYVCLPTSTHSCTLWVTAITRITPAPTHLQVHCRARGVHRVNVRMKVGSLK